MRPYGRGSRTDVANQAHQKRLMQCERFTRVGTRLAIEAAPRSAFEPECDRRTNEEDWLGGLLFCLGIARLSRHVQGAVRALPTLTVRLSTYLLPRRSGKHQHGQNRCKKPRCLDAPGGSIERGAPKAPNRTRRAGRRGACECRGREHVARDEPRRGRRRRGLGAGFGQVVRDWLAARRRAARARSRRIRGDDSRVRGDHRSGRRPGDRGSGAAEGGSAHGAFEPDRARG